MTDLRNAIAGMVVILCAIIIGASIAVTLFGVFVP